MARLVVWTPEEAKKNLAQRLIDSREQRASVERNWRTNEKTVYNTKGEPLTPDLNFNIEQTLGLIDGPDQGSSSVNINYSMKNLRYIHAQLSANPPSVIPRPTSSDPDDRRKADAADRIIRFALKKYQLQEVSDRTTLNTLLYGTGFTKVQWDAEAGEILDVNEEDGTLVMEGDLSITVPNIWNIFLDPDAESWDKVRYVFEKMVIPWEEALYRWPEKRELLEKLKIRRQDNTYTNGAVHNDSALRNPKFDVVELYEYWEKGMPHNGMLGRYCICTYDGTLVTEVTANPEKYAPPKKSKGSEQAKFEIATLPYIPLTDIDTPSHVWGKSHVEFGATLQNMLNRLDTVALDAVQAHGIPRLMLPEGAEVSEDSITNSPWDIVKFTGNQPPSFMPPMPMPAIVTDLMARYKAGLDDVAGVNESMFGQQSREQSGFSMQYATNQGNMIRYRLLNKYRAFSEALYKQILQIIQKHWEIPRTVQVLGKENAFEAVDLKGADIVGGYDLVADYGASLSLDPTARREEMITLMPLFEKAGVESRALLKMMKLNELSGAYDVLDLAEDRQRELFEEIIATGKYLPPEDLQDHKNMLSYAYTYLMTSEFKYLDQESKHLIKQHVKDRELLAAKGAQPAGGDLGGPNPPGPLPGGLAGGPLGAPPPLPGPGQMEAPPLP